MELKVNKKKLSLILIGSLFLSFCATLISFYEPGFLKTNEFFRYNEFSIFTLVYRNILFTIVGLFLGCHFIFDRKELYRWIFDHRWLLGGVLLIVFTLLRMNGESITFYYENVQSRVGDASMYPVLGTFRGIRSDQFVATTPSQLASSYGTDPFGVYNEISRGTKTLNAINGIYVGFSTLAYAPWYFVYKILPFEYANSFCWYAPIILAFLFNIELFYIVSKKNRLLATMGGCLTVFSSFYMWWNFPSQWLSAPGTVVCVYYFLNNDDLKKRIVYGLGTALCFAGFVVHLYPAWQVPLGYLYLVIGIWCLYSNWDRVKKMDKKSWLLLAGCILLMCALIVSYMLNISEYSKIIMETVYPGKRVGLGGNSLYKLFLYLQQTFYPYFQFGNPCEFSTFFTLFPIPLIVAIYVLIRNKKKDFLLVGILLAILPMLVYCTIGFPEFLAKITLLSYSTAQRCVDVIGYAQIFILVILFTEYREEKRLPVWLAVVLSFGIALYCLYITMHMFPGYLRWFIKGGMCGVILVLGVVLSHKFSDRLDRFLQIALIGITLFSSVLIHPFMVGLSALTQKPVAQEIHRIVQEDPDAKWIALEGGIFFQQFVVANGASTINSLNSYPNLDLWHTLDESRQYENVYNRYAHIPATLTTEDTSFELQVEDTMLLSLSYKDMEKVNISYVITMNSENLEMDNGYAHFECLYNEYDIAIYKVTYSRS
ncbi:MAG: hypothetical protein Q4C49_04585 [Bacillota bacterium]|nr:hypothetical protein [Bacillota bacterium]